MSEQDKPTKTDASGPSKPPTRVIMTDADQRWEEYVRAERKMPKVTTDEKLFTTINPNALPPEVEALRTRHNLATCLSPPARTDYDWQIIHELEAAGYVLAKRENLGNLLPDRFYNAAGGVVINGQNLWICRVETKEARRARERDKSAAMVKAAEAGHDDLGQIPYVERDKAVDLTGGEVFTIPDQYGDNAPEVEIVR